MFKKIWYKCFCGIWIKIINKKIKYILTNYKIYTLIRQELLLWTSIKIFLFHQLLFTNCFFIVFPLSKKFLVSNDQNKKWMTQEYENLQDMLDFKQVHYPGTFPSWNLSRHARSADSHAGIVTAATPRILITRWWTIFL